MSHMKYLFLVSLATFICAQTTFTLSGCHEHDGQEYCYLPNGSEVPFTRSATEVPTPTATRTTSPASVVASTTVATVPASVTGCHAHDAAQYCLADGTEWEVLQTPSITPLPTAYSGCHTHEGEVLCIASDGTEVPIVLESAETSHTETSHEEITQDTHEDAERSSSGQNCHFHAGVEHCIGGSESGESTSNCDLVQRDYSIRLRIGLIFVVLFGSAFAVFSPILLERFSTISLNSIVFVVLKQFGTGVILSTAFVHLLTHAELMFNNSCLDELAYEATATSIAMAGVFVAFIVEYFGNRLIHRRQQPPSQGLDDEPLPQHAPESPTTKGNAAPDSALAALGHGHSGELGPDSHFSVAVMESGIVFHSILIGITLNVTPDSFYVTFFVVILFHQMFEGLALGTRIAAIPSSCSMTIKLLMATIFTLITPIGMAIGAGVLSHFNGNDPSTIVALGTLNALSAGILLWVGLVEMLAHDWMRGDMLKASLGKAVIGMISLVIGVAIMSLLGKWA